MLRKSILLRQNYTPQNIPSQALIDDIHCMGFFEALSTANSVKGAWRTEGDGPHFPCWKPNTRQVSYYALFIPVYPFCSVLKEEGIEIIGEKH